MKDCCCCEAMVFMDDILADEDKKDACNAEIMKKVDKTGDVLLLWELEE